MSIPVIISFTASAQTSVITAGEEPIAEHRDIEEELFLLDSLSRFRVSVSTISYSMKAATFLKEEVRKKGRQKKIFSASRWE